MNIKSTIIKVFLTVSLATIGNYAQIGVIVNQDLFPSIAPAVSTLINDITTVEGKTVWLDTSGYISSSSPAALRSALKTRFDNYGLEGVILIGDLPLVEFEIEDDFNEYGYTTFPFDLYFMDLDGNWLDTATDGMWGGNAQTGIFDGHQAGTGNKLAEIWVSRIIGSTVSGLSTEDIVINEYLARVHTRMVGNDDLDEKMVICGYDSGDRSWSSCVSWAGASLLNYASANVTTYLRSTPIAQDSKANWIGALQAGQEYAALFEHSSATSHSVVDYFSSTDYLQMPLNGGASNVRFYNLFACSNSRYTVNNFLGGLYAWGHNGLISMGSTKTGSMLGFDYYNEPLGNDSSFGEAFKDWLNVYVLPVENFDRLCWHYGMTLLGVGTLHKEKYAVVEEDNEVMGFEDPNLWSIIVGSGTLTQNTTNTTEGDASMQVGGNGWRQIKSVDVATTDLPPVQNKVLVDLFVGTTQPNPWWIGEVQFYVNCPSAGIYNQYVGNVQLTSLPRGVFSTVQFTLPQNIKNVLNGNYDDFSFSMALNTNWGSGPYYLDNMRFSN